MSIRLYVGNLPFSATHSDLEDLFSPYGHVSDVHLVTDKMTGRARGFAFVTMESDAGASAAIAAVHGKELGGRSLTVNEARPREEVGGSRRGGGGFGSGRHRR